MSRSGPMVWPSLSWCSSHLNVISSEHFFKSIFNDEIGLFCTTFCIKRSGNLVLVVSVWLRTLNLFAWEIKPSTKFESEKTFDYHFVLAPPVKTKKTKRVCMDLESRVAATYITLASYMHMMKFKEYFWFEESLKKNVGKFLILYGFTTFFVKLNLNVNTNAIFTKAFNSKHPLASHLFLYWGMAMFEPCFSLV